MKTRIISLLSLLALLLTTWACEKAPIDDGSIDEIQSEEITTEVEIATVEDLIQDTETEVDLQLALRSDTTNAVDSSSASTCVTITRLPETGFPATTTIDFGNGCIGPKGRVRSGQVIVRQTDSLHLYGAERVLTFNNFVVDEIQIEGSRVLANLGLNDQNQPIWQRQVIEAVITFPDNTTITWDSDYTRTQIRGIATPRKIDDVFKTEGYTEGENRKGIAFEHTIINPLVNSRDCRWIQAGQIEVNRGDKMRTIDFGNGFCDPVVIINYPNGQTRRVVLDWKWWKKQNG